MSPPRSNGPLGRLTPDSRGVRLAVAATAAVAAAVLLYSTALMASSTLSGTWYTLFTWALGALTLLAAGVAPTVLLAPDAWEESRTDDSAIELAKRRYAAGELSEAEFAERVETLIDAERRAEAAVRPSIASGTPGSREAEHGMERG